MVQDNKSEAERQRDDARGVRVREVCTEAQREPNGTIKEMPLMNENMKGRSSGHLWAIYMVLSSSWHHAHLMDLCTTNTWVAHNATANQTRCESPCDSVHPTLSLKGQLMLSHACWDNNGNKHFIQPSLHCGTGNTQAIGMNVPLSTFVAVFREIDGGVFFN